MPTVEKRKAKAHENPLQRGISCQGRTERKRLAELLANKKSMGPILGFLKATEVGGREGAREREEEWWRKNDQLGEDLLEWTR